MSGPATCFQHDAGPCHQQAVGGPSHDDQAFSVQFELYRQVNDVLAFAVLVAFSIVVLLVMP